MNTQQKEWATLVVAKTKGGRAVILNESQRGFFEKGQRYFSHQLYSYPDNAVLNVVVRFSRTGRRMIQAIREKKVVE